MSNPLLPAARTPGGASGRRPGDSVGAGGVGRIAGVTAGLSGTGYRTAQSCHRAAGNRDHNAARGLSGGRGYGIFRRRVGASGGRFHHAR